MAEATARTVGKSVEKTATSLATGGERRMRTGATERQRAAGT